MNQADSLSENTLEQSKRKRFRKRYYEKDEAQDNVLIIPRQTLWNRGLTPCWNKREKSCNESTGDIAQTANAHFEIEHLDATTSTQSCTGNDTDSDGDTNMDTGNRIEPSFQINYGLRDRDPINSRRGPNDVSEILDATADSSYEDSGDGNRTSENDSEADQDSEEYDNNFADGDGTLEATNGDNTYEDGAFFNNNQEWDDAQPSDATSYSSHEDSGSDCCTSENDNETDQGGEENEYSLSDGDGSVKENRAHTGPDGDSGNEDEALNNFQGGQDNTSQSSDDSGSGSSSSENDIERDQEREDNANSSDEGEGRDNENGAHREPNEDNENFEMCDPFKRLKSSVEYSFSIERQLQVNISIGEILINALALVKNHNWSHLEKEHLMKFAQSILKCGKILPDSRFLLDQYFYSKEDMQYFFFCSCFYKSLGDFPAKQTRPERIVCPIATCETVNILSDLSQATYFVTFYLPSQIEVLLSNPDIRRKLVSPSAFVNVPGDNVMRDLYDGKMYRKFANIVKDECNSGVKVLSLSLPVDSASLCSFSGQKICPCFVMINELPPVLRMGNPLLAGLWFGLVKEKMDLFLPPIIKHITKLSSQGFFLKFSPEEEWFVKVFLIASCADSVARCDIQGIPSHRGDFPCSWCLEEGEEYTNCRIFRHTGPLAPPRTIRGLIEDASNAIRTQTFVNGVKYLSPLAAAPLFHPVDGFIVDQLHAKDEGTTKAFILAWLNDGQNYPHYIGIDHQKDLINAKLKKISLPKEARKNIRDLNNLAFWTGRENENFGLFLSVPVLVDILPSRFLKHWALYVQVNYILLCTEIPIDVLPIVEAIVDEFVSQVERLYYPEMMRFNMHLFRHFVDNARRWGGIYALSAYGFEAGNQKFKKLVHSANFIPNQICRGLAEENALVLLKRHCSTETTKAFESSFDRKASTSSLYDRTGKVRLLKKGKLFKATVKEEWFINRMGKECADFLQYSQLQKDGCCFGTHSGRRRLKTDNSFAMLASKEIILIRKILYHEPTSEVWIVGSKVRCEPSPYCPLSIVRFDPSLCFQYSVISIDEDIGFHEVESLSKVCVNIKLDNCHYLSQMPNIFNMY